LGLAAAAAAAAPPPQLRQELLLLPPPPLLVLPPLLLLVRPGLLRLPLLLHYLTAVAAAAEAEVLQRSALAPRCAL
jgi:hypothetical protein